METFKIVNHICIPGYSMMSRCSFVSKGWKANVKTVVGILSLVCFVFMLPGPVDALQTALVRASDGSVYQIRFRNKDVNQGYYGLRDFVSDFSIYDRTGKVKLCLGNGEEVTRELYAAARILAKTRRYRPVFNTSALAEALEQAVEDQNLTPVRIADKLVVGEVVGNITRGIQSYTFLKGLDIVPKSGPLAIIEVPATLISKLGNVEIRMRKLLYAFWIASGHANTARVLQKLANQKASELWDSINAGKIVDIFHSGSKVDIGAGKISGDMSVDTPLLLRLMAQVYQDNAERAAELGADLGKSEDAWFSWLTSQTGIVEDILQLFVSGVDAWQLKSVLEDLEDFSADKIELLIRWNVRDLYDSAAFDLNWSRFCAPNLKFTLPGKMSNSVYEGYNVPYTVALNSPPDSMATITISSDNNDATVFPAVLTFTPDDWYKPKTLIVSTAEDTDSMNDKVYLSHAVTGYGVNLIQEIRFDIIDRKGNRSPEPLDTIEPQTLQLGDNPIVLDASNYFHDPEGGELHYGASSKDYSIVLAIPEKSGSLVTIRPQEVGSTTVTVWATDSGDLQATQTFTVTVVPRRPLQNQRPIASLISAKTLSVGGESASVNLSNYFHDPDDDPLTYTAWTDPKPNRVVRLERNGSQLTITPRGEGTAEVVVSARDPEGSRVFQRISVTVEPTRAPAPTRQRFEKGDAVIVQDLRVGVTLKVRTGPGKNNKKIEDIGNGVTGTITDGPQQNDGFTWWKVKWDASGLEGWSVEADGGQILFRWTQDPVTQSYDLAIQSFKVSKRTLDPGESFTLAVTIRNNGPAKAADFGLSYYHSSIQGRASTDQPQLQGTVWLDPIAPGKSKTKLIRLNAPSVPRTYYYGAWLTANTDDTNIYNDVVTEVGVTVTDRPIQTSKSPDLVIESISENNVIVAPGEDFKLDAVVRNQGRADAPSTYLRYYRSSNRTISADDTEVGDDRMTTPDAGKTYDKWEKITAPDTPGVYYYGACVDSVRGESNTDNNCSEAIKITVQTVLPPDLVIESISANRVSLDPNGTFKLNAVVRNQGGRNSHSTKLRYYRSSDAIFSADDTEVNTRSVRSLEVGETSDGLKTLRVPDAPGVYYYIVCLDSVKDESNTDNNCSETIQITVKAPSLPNLIVESISVNDDTLKPGESFILSATVRNKGTSKAYTTWLRYHGPGGHEIGKNRVARLSPTVASNQNINLEAPDEVGTYYYEACVDSVHGETEVHDNCSTRIAVTVGTPANRVPVAVGSISSRTLTMGRSSVIVDVSDKFRDLDNDRLSYTARSDNTSIATVSVSGSQITLTPKSAGTTMITVTANDRALTATQRFSVTVTSAPVTNRALVTNRAPVTVGTISPRTLAVGDPSERVDVFGNFMDPENDSLVYTVRSDNTRVAIVNVSGSRVTIIPQEVGSATVTVIASDGALKATQRFSITVTATPVTNRAPVAVGTISSQTLTVDDPSEHMNVSGNFRDPDNDNLVYTVRSDNTGVATVKISGSQVTITSQGIGSAIMTVTASDGTLTATQNFTVTVTGNRDPGVNTPPTSQGICDRTPQVLNEILYEIDVDDCADVGSEDLSTITSLDIGEKGITTLQENDFERLSNLEDLELHDNSLSSLPIGVFDDLSALDELYLWRNSLRSLRVGVFDGLSALVHLDLNENSLRSLPVNVFDGLSALTHLSLENNALNSLPAGAFNGLSALRDLDLRGNSLDSLPAGVFDGLSALDDLDLRGNSLRSLPVGIFDGLSALESLNLEDNQLTTLPQGIFDDVLDTLQNLYVDVSLKATVNFGATAQDAAAGATVRVPVSLSRALPVAVRVIYTVGGTATASDYTNLQTPHELLFLAGETSKEIVFTLLEDADTTAETVFLTLGDFDDDAMKLRKSDGSGPDANLRSNRLLNLPQQRVHTVTITTSGGGVSRPLYWTGGVNKIYRSKLDGTQPQVLVEGGNPGGIALDVSGGKMYWIEHFGDEIRRANLDGSEIVSWVTDLKDPDDIALDVSGGKMYWTDSGGSKTGSGKIQRANLDGSSIEDLVTGLNVLLGIALDVSSGKMYWTDRGSGKIQRANLNGSGVEDLVTGLDYPRDIALDVPRDKMYWTGSGKIQRANLNGSGVEDLVTGLEFPDDIALDVSRGKMYWADGNENRIQRANLDGSQVEQLYSGSIPIGIALAITPATHAAPLAVSTNLAVVSPNETMLLPNYPNPFNPETWIPYQLSKSADVTLHIYAVNGTLVRTLTLGYQPAGIYQSRSRAVYWDGKNEVGEPVASGVYFYTLTAGDFTATRKMLIQK